MNNDHSFARLFAHSLEMAMNQALKMDTYHRTPFAAFDGHCFELCFLPVTSVFVTLTEQHIHVQTCLHGSVTAKISADLLDWRNALPKLNDNADCIDLSKFKFEGETAQAEAFLKALSSIEIDWEDSLSHYTGDILAHQIGQGLRQYFAQKRDFKNTVSETLQEYIEHELQLLPYQNEIDEWCQQVDALQQQAIELQERLNLLKK